MRIGIDIRPLMERRVTGVQVYIKNLLLSLFEQDQKNQYILFANSYQDVSDILPKFDYPNVQLKLFRYPNKLFMLSQILFSWPKIDRMVGGVDLFFSPHWRRTAIGNNVPLVVTFHDLSFEIVPDFFTYWDRFWHRMMGYKRIVKRANYLIAVSSSTKFDLEDLYGVKSQKIKVVYPGVSLSDDSSDAGLEIPQNYFLALGTFEPRKNIQAVILAYDQYLNRSEKKIDLVLAGSRGWKEKLQIPERLKNKIKIYKDLSENEKTCLLKNAKALIFASYYEGFGFPVMEAALAGVPVICSANTSLQEIASKFALLVNPFRSEQIASSMLELETDQELYASMREHGFKTAQKFTWRKSAQEVLEIFKDIEKQSGTEIN